MFRGEYLPKKSIAFAGRSRSLSLSLSFSLAGRSSLLACTANLSIAGLSRLAFRLLCLLRLLRVLIIRLLRFDGEPLPMRRRFVSRRVSSYETNIPRR